MALNNNYGRTYKLEIVDDQNTPASASILLVTV